MSSDTSPTGELLSQWQNPGDIFALLLIIGGDIIQKAIARLAGVRLMGLHVNPVAFSFGWVAYGFMALASALGHEKLMPEAEIPIKVINCDTGYDRDNQSWVLGRLLRDRGEARVAELGLQATPPKDSTGAVSMAIDIFVAEESNGPKPGLFWGFCVLVIFAQQGLGITAWACYGTWSIFMITSCGTMLSILTASWPQWIKEKWPSKHLTDDTTKRIALTKGNGHCYVMLILCHQGSWDLEAMASNRHAEFPGTRWIFGFFVILWVLLLITVTGIKEHTWFLIAVGTLGMLQNVFAAALPCSADDLDIKLKAWHTCSTIVGYQRTRAEKKKLKEDDWTTYTAHDPSKPDQISDAQTEYERKLEPKEVRDVMGALMELEKYFPKAGASLLPTFFPNGVDYEPGFKINREKHFWQYAGTQRERT